MISRIFSLVLVSQCLACTLLSSGEMVPDELDVRTSSVQGAPFQLRVSLYPWIPEPDSFLAWIEADFESKNPDIDLVVRPLVKSYDWDAQYVADLAYELDKTVTALTDASDLDHQDLIEVDTLILGPLAERNAIVTFDVPGAGFLPEAIESVKWNGRRLGVPHWTCGTFLISEDPAISSVRNVGEMISTLHGAGTDRVDLVGDLGGSWGAIGTYLDAFRDTYPGGDMQEALMQSQIDPAVDVSLRALRASCLKEGVNYCGADGVDLFATGGADALIGFSERLNPILSHPGKTVGTLHIASATLGGGDRPLAFVDALVRSPTCTEECFSAAQRFASYYVSDEVFEVSLMALDTQSGVPRYLLPSTKTSFEYGRVGQDRLYRELRREIQNSKPLPTSGVLEARSRGTIQQQVEEALGL